MSSEIFEGCFLKRETGNNKNKAFLAFSNDENKKKLINPNGKVIDYNSHLFTDIQELREEWFNKPQKTNYIFETDTVIIENTRKLDLNTIKKYFLSTKDEDKPIILKHMIFFSHRHGILERSDRSILNSLSQKFRRFRKIINEDLELISIYLKILIDHGYWSPRF